MEPTLVTLGDLVADLIVPIDELPIQAQQHQIAHDMTIEAGSTGSVLILAARLGLRARALGVVGQDLYGEHVRAALAASGVDVGGVVAPPGGRTTTSIGLVDGAGQHVFVWMRGTGLPQHFNPAWRPIVEQAGAVFSTGYALQPPATFTPAAVLEGIAIAHARNIPVFFDLGPAAGQAVRAHVDAAIGQATVFLATSEEIAGWTGLADPQRAAREILSRGPAMVVVKLGADGCLIVTPDHEQQIEAFPVAVRNTAGAGDAFSAACIYGYLRGFPLRQIGLLANAAGALTVAALGTGTCLPQRAAIAELLARHGHAFHETME